MSALPPPRPVLSGRPYRSAQNVEEEEEGAPLPKCSLWLRAGARLFDVAVAAGLNALMGSAGTVVALLFLLLSDGFLPGQSMGKRMFGVKVVFLPTRVAARFRESVLRNAPFALVVLLGMMPPPLGGVSFVAGALVIGFLEGWKVYRDPQGLRLGDVWALTQVIDGKVPVDSQAEAPLEGEDARVPERLGRMMYAARHRRGTKRRREKCASR